MRDFILLYINGREHRISGPTVLLPITDYLRSELGLCGSKVVCAEGDCGACSVMVGRVPSRARDLAATGSATATGNAAATGDAAKRKNATASGSAGARQLPGEHQLLVYKTLNACIQYIFQLDCTHIITVEGLKLNGKLNPVQQAMVDCHGAQCGYCTPGFIVTMCSLFNGGSRLSAGEIKDGLVGNLCRCTGYEAIIKAGLNVDLNDWNSIETLYPSARIVQQFKDHLSEPVYIKTNGRELFIPTTVSDACHFKNKNGNVSIVSGGTDVSVNMNKRGYAPEAILSTSNLRDPSDSLHRIVETEVDGRKVLEVGALVTLLELENHIARMNKERENEIAGSNEELKYILWVFGSPQIRNAGTLAGNIANGSPIADTLPCLFVMDAEVEATGVNGCRKIPMTALYKGYRTLALQSDEIITRVFLPLPRANEMLKLYKISRRQHLDISAFTAAIRLTMDGDKIARAGVAYGGVAPVVLRLPAVENFLTGKSLTLDVCREAGRLARSEVAPISDVRGSKDYRLQLAENIFSRFFYETAERELVCQ